jgi:hypothetical protein
VSVGWLFLRGVGDRKGLLPEITLSTNRYPTRKHQPYYKLRFTSDKENKNEYKQTIKGVK